MSAALAILLDEHRVILRTLATLEAAVERLAARRPLPDALWDEMLEWLRAFADRAHHAKEEIALFPALIKAGVPSPGGPIEVMLEEHAEGRALLAVMGTGSTVERVTAGRRYVRLLRDHIDKENSVLFPLAEAILDARGHAELLREFLSVEVEPGTQSLAPAEEAALRFAARLPD
jgi:hemerythrin-like domain-containing protein